MAYLLIEYLQYESNVGAPSVNVLGEMLSLLRQLFYYQGPCFPTPGTQWLRDIQT